MLTEKLLSCEKSFMSHILLPQT